jgi:alpha-glucan,water dikinase
VLGGLPRGGGNGDDIRMGILHIMRANGIREGHRPVGGAPALAATARACLLHLFCR